MCWLLQKGYSGLVHPIESTIRNTLEKFEEIVCIGERVSIIDVCLQQRILLLVMVWPKTLNCRLVVFLIGRVIYIAPFGSFCMKTCIHLKLSQYTQELSWHEQQRIYADWLLELQEIDASFPKTILFSDEAHFLLPGYVKKKTWRNGGEKYLYVIYEI